MSRWRSMNNDRTIFIHGLSPMQLFCLISSVFMNNSGYGVCLLWFVLAVWAPPFMAGVIYLRHILCVYGWLGDLLWTLQVGFVHSPPAPMWYSSIQAHQEHSYLPNQPIFPPYTAHLRLYINSSKAGPVHCEAIHVFISSHPICVIDSEYRTRRCESLSLIWDGRHQRYSFYPPHMWWDL